MYAELQAFQMLTHINNYDLKRKPSLCPTKLIAQLEPSNKIQIITTQDEILYVLAPIEDTHVLFGPILQNVITDKQREALSECFNAPLSNDFFAKIPLIQIDELKSTFALLNVLFNKGTLSQAMDLFEIVFPDEEKGRKEYVEEIDNTLEEESYDSRLSIYHCIKEGNSKALLLCMKSQEANRNKTKDLPLRDFKYRALSTICVAAYEATQGGLADYIAEGLQNQYMKELAGTKTNEEIYSILGQAYFRFCDEVSKVKQGKFAVNTELSDCIRYIGLHVNQPISLEEVAERYGYNTAYFSRKFKNTYHVTFERFVLQARLSEAKRQLEYTDKPLSEISNFLAFSSQSHMQRAFKKEFNETPLEYRKRTQHRV